MSDFILLQDIVGHDLNDIFNIQCRDWIVMRMYLAAIWVDNAMEDKFMSISNTFHFDPNCLLIFTGYCEVCLSKL